MRSRIRNPSSSQQQHEQRNKRIHDFITRNQREDYENGLPGLLGGGTALDGYRSFLRELATPLYVLHTYVVRFTNGLSHNQRILSQRTLTLTHQIKT